MEEQFNIGFGNCFSKPTDANLLLMVIAEPPYFYWRKSENGWELFHSQHSLHPNSSPAYTTDELFRYLLKPEIEVKNEKLYQVMSRTEEGEFEFGYIRENGECISEVGETIIETQMKLIRTLFLKRLFNPILPF